MLHGVTVIPRPLLLDFWLTIRSFCLRSDLFCTATGRGLSPGSHQRSSSSRRSRSSFTRTHGSIEQGSPRSPRARPRRRSRGHPSRTGVLGWGKFSTQPLITDACLSGCTASAWMSRPNAVAPNALPYDRGNAPACEVHRFIGMWQQESG